MASVAEAADPRRLADLVSGHLGIDIARKQDLLETLDVAQRLEKVYGLMQGEMSVLQVEKKIKSRVKNQMEKTQREYYLNEQMKAIQRELGNEGEDGDQDEVAELTQKIATLKLSKEARQKATSELKKLKTMAPMSAEATVVRNYLDVLLGLPWGKRSKIKRDLVAAEAVLNEDHYALDKVKDRILEYLAVQARTNKLKGPILCLVGPPGVGKTSLGKSIAKATGREFVRQSLGGVRDEAEIRGHRRTYVGALPGRIVRAIGEAGSMNPVVLLDEIDKVGSDFRGDPAAALLEVLGQGRPRRAPLRLGGVAAPLLDHVTGFAEVAVKVRGQGGGALQRGGLLLQPPTGAEAHLHAAPVGLGQAPRHPRQRQARAEVGQQVERQRTRHALRAEQAGLSMAWVGGAHVLHAPTASSTRGVEDLAVFVRRWGYEPPAQEAVTRTSA